MPRAGRITTFYSYKGGTGRSMALANFAWIMAACGRRVLTIDWDLEAPGLHRYFRPFLIDPDLFETDGLIDAFWSLTASALEKALAGAGTRDETADGEDVLEALEDATRRLDWKFPSGGHIDFIGAGRQGGTYSERVNSFDWKRFYELGGGDMLNAAKGGLRAQYDWVLIDSRTGVSDTSGISTIQMPETVVPFFTLNRQSVEGVAAILRSIRAYRSPTTDGSKINFFPVATRIENAEKDRLAAARKYARDALADFLPAEMRSRPREYWDRMEITYTPWYAFEEVLAAFGDTTGAGGGKDTMLSQVESMAQLIAGDDSLRAPEIVEADRDRVLAKYSFGALTAAEKKEPAHADDTEFLRHVREKEQLWRTNKFPWKLLLSRRELDLLTEEDQKGFGRNMTFYHVQSERIHRLLRVAHMVGLGAFVATFIVGFLFSSNILHSLMYVSSDFASTPIVRAMIAFGVALYGYMFAKLIGMGILEKPEGLRPVDMILLSIPPLFHPRIRDYEPSDKPSP